MLTKEKLMELLRYDPNTGDFIVLKKMHGNGKSVGSIAGSPHIGGYLQITINQENYLLHRLAFLYMNGEMPEIFVDHINGNRSDNRFCNLRLVSQEENNRNMKLPKNNTSGRIGVHWRKDIKTWESRIKINKKHVSLGCFKCFIDAVAARIRAEKSDGYHANHGRAT